jgi:hypothetical protein
LSLPKSEPQPTIVVAAKPVEVPSVEKRIRDCLAGANVDKEKLAAVPPGPWTQAQVEEIVSRLAGLVDAKSQCGRDLIADSDRIRKGLRGTKR